MSRKFVSMGVGLKYRAILPISSLSATRRCFTTTIYSRQKDDRIHPNVEEHRQAQKERPLNPHMTNTASAKANEMPSVGADKAPPELLSSVEPGFVPNDKRPGNTERMTGGTQESAQADKGDLNVGEIEGGSFRIEPLRRIGEDPETMRARLLYQSRKRGTLESDLLLSTFANTYLEKMTPGQLKQYDTFLDENDWDIYYWATQEPSPTSLETAEGVKGKDQYVQQLPRPGEWAQTVGTFKAAYRPVPARWQGSDILELLRDHVKDSSQKEGMGFMPALK